MQKRYSVLLAVSVFTGCAGRQHELAPDAGRSVLTRYYGNVTAEVHGSIDPSRHVLNAPLDSVWGVLPGVFERLGIEATTIDPSGYQIANTRFVTRRIDGSRMSRFLECGSSVGYAEIADSYRVTISVVSRVRLDENRQTLLQTELAGSAEPRQVSGNAVICTTTGRLEQRIADLTSAVLRGDVQPHTP